MVRANAHAQGNGGPHQAVSPSADGTTRLIAHPVRLRARSTRMPDADGIERRGGSRRLGRAARLSAPPDPRLTPSRRWRCIGGGMDGTIACETIKPNTHAPGRAVDRAVGRHRQCTRRAGRDRTTPVCNGTRRSTPALPRLRRSGSSRSVARRSTRSGAVALPANPGAKHERRFRLRLRISRRFRYSAVRSLGPACRITPSRDAQPSKARLEGACDKCQLRNPRSVNARSCSGRGSTAPCARAAVVLAHPSRGVRQGGRSESNTPVEAANDPGR
jgi:hypothetical protein